MKIRFVYVLSMTWRDIVFVGTYLFNKSCKQMEKKLVLMFLLHIFIIDILMFLLYIVIIDILMELNKTSLQWS